VGEGRILSQAAAWRCDGAAGGQGAV